MPDGALLTGGGTDVLRISPTGEVSAIFTGFEQVRGLAYDAELQRLFLVEHSLTPGTRTACTSSRSRCSRSHIRPLAL